MSVTRIICMHAHILNDLSCDCFLVIYRYIKLATPGALRAPLHTHISGMNFNSD